MTQFSPQIVLEPTSLFFFFIPQQKGGKKKLKFLLTVNCLCNSMIYWYKVFRSSDLHQVLQKYIYILIPIITKSLWHCLVENMWLTCTNIHTRQPVHHSNNRDMKVQQTDRVTSFSVVAHWIHLNTENNWLQQYYYIQDSRQGQGKGWVKSTHK